MKWIRDTTGRFPQRPYYEPGELDSECEQTIYSFLRDRHGGVSFPISTDDLTILIEGNTSHLDLYADLSTAGEDVEGVTDFFADKRPFVRITKELSLANWKQNRLRTTLMHEYGHVRFHDFLWQLNRPTLFIDSGIKKGPRCKRATILTAPKTDWLEWQAGYASGALLMPVTALRNIVQDFFREKGLYNYVTADSDEAQILIRCLTEKFDVSNEAGRVRLSQLGYLSTLAPGIPLFSQKRS